MYRQVLVIEWVVTGKELILLFLLCHDEHDCQHQDCHPAKTLCIVQAGVGDGVGDRGEADRATSS